MTPSELQQEFNRLGSEKAEYRAKAYLLEKQVKSVQAEQYMKARADKSQGDADQYALTTPEYKAALEAAAFATGAAETAKVRYDALMAKFDMWRTMESTKRAEMTLR